MKKSVTVACKYKLARSIARVSRTGKLQSARATKLLGTPSGGGRRRSVRALAMRLPAFNKKIWRLHAARKAGVNVQQIVRAAGTPAVTYGVEITGMADTHLTNARRSIARAAAPEGHGKNPDLVLLTCDTLRGTMDPAFDAHVMPIKTWALAWWQRWRPKDVFLRAMRAALRKLESTPGSGWHAATGPVMALVATTKRLGWTIPSAHTLQTDTGRLLDLELDSPAAVAFEVRNAVRRWRLSKIANSFPQLVPSTPDLGACSSSAALGKLLPEGTVDLTDVLHKLLKGRARSSKVFSLWENRFRPDLVSATSGGQWPQARLASIRTWTDDARCQLCLGGAGTLEHRHHCPATEPHGGWPQAPARVQSFIASLDHDRRRLLLTRGLLAVRVIVPNPHGADSFHWIRSPQDDIPLDAKWYIDGSMFDASRGFAKRTGFGVVVISVTGDLLAYGNGIPPNWIQDAAGAEAWAFASILRLCPFLPDTTTDCLNIVQAVTGGCAAATSASSPLARIWVSVFPHARGASL